MIEKQHSSLCRSRTAHEENGTSRICEEVLGRGQRGRRSGNGEDGNGKDGNGEDGGNRPKSAARKDSRDLQETAADR